MAKRVRVHSRDVQPQIVAPLGRFAAARVQRLDFPLSIPTTNIDELGRKLHVGTTQETPEVNVTFDAFDVSHNTYAYLTGYDPGTFPTAGVSVTEFKTVDVIGQIRNITQGTILNSIYVKRGIVTGMDATFGVRDNSSVSYTVGANSKKELAYPVFFDKTTASGGQTAYYLSQTPNWLTRSSGYIINAMWTDVSTGVSLNLNEGTDFTVAGSTVTTTGFTTEAGDVVWFTYSANATQNFDTLDDVAPAAIQGKYVPVTISVSSIPRVQSASIRASFTAESIYEMGGLGKPVGREIGIPDVTGDLSVLKTDNDLVNLLTGQVTTETETDLEFGRTDLPLKITLYDPAEPTRPVLTYYVPSITINAEGDESTVNNSMNETFSWTSTTGDLFIASGAGPW